MTLNELLSEIRQSPDKVEFDYVISTINAEYKYLPSKFTNGKGNNMVVNEASTNEGSCKIFAFAKLNNLTKDQTLACFGKYYRDDVLNNPDGNDHANIRTLMKYGLDSIQFESTALTKN